MNCRKVAPEDYEVMRDLAYRCKPLDLHTPYTYWVCSHYFSDTCVILENEDKLPVGYIMGLYRGKIAFVWQIGILKEYRGKGLSSLLIGSFENMVRERGCNGIQATIDPKNINSNSAFKNYAAKHGYPWKEIGRVVVKDSQENILETEHEVVFQMDLI